MSVGTYYLNDPNAPKPNSPTHIGTNVLLEYDGKLLLERRWDCGQWGLIGGRLRNAERYSQGIAREVREETGIFLPESAFEQLRVVDDDRIASYRDGTVWRMIIVLFRAKLDRMPTLKPSKESGELRFFSPEELKELDIVVTHRDLVEKWKPFD
ncbi:MAG: NUDIX hydrolase [Oscillospiraceae bacterium]|nr:NUDIX hydrolase [Oscillospiraceae bacterium]